jgi:hypothetical protein
MQSPIAIRFRRIRGKLGVADLEHRRITLHPDQNEISLMGSAIHEVLHLELWDLDERAVLRRASAAWLSAGRKGWRMTKYISDEEFITAWKLANGSPIVMARQTGLSERAIYRRRNSIEKRLGFQLDSSPNNKNKVRDKSHVTKIGYRITEEARGTVIVFGDGHFWPGERSVAFGALVTLIKRLNPSMVVCEGDAFDGARISRHAPGGWANLPDVADELAAVQERLGEIEACAPEKCKLIWTVGNHDSRFTSKLAQFAPDYVRVRGMDITDHFPAFNFAWSLFLNGHTVIKHRINSGIHAAYNNTLKAGRNIITGHTHRLQVTAFADYNSLRYGVEAGTVSEYTPESDKYAYAEDNPQNHSQGFVVLNFADDGKLLEPEICRVIGNRAYFRGEPVE